MKASTVLLVLLAHRAAAQINRTCVDDAATRRINSGEDSLLPNLHSSSPQRFDICYFCARKKKMSAIEFV
jgi:hypothetical protein